MYFRLDNISFYFGLLIVLFIFASLVVIFIPNNNFFDVEYYYPKLKKLLSNEEIFDKTNEKLEKTKKWDIWPDQKIINGEVQILPIYMFSKLYTKNIKKFNKFYDLMCKIGGIRSIYFLYLKPNSSIAKHFGWKEISNDTLKLIYSLNSYNDEDDCGIWINGEVKALSKGSYHLFDSSKEHSIYNNSDDDLYFLIIDLERPHQIPKGASKYEMIKS